MNDFSEALSALVQLGKDTSHVKVNLTDVNSVVDRAPAYAALTVPHGIGQHDITDKLLARLPTPQRRKGSLVMLSPKSLVDYVNRYVEYGRTVIFADTSTRQVTAILNYHESTRMLVEPATDAPDDAPHEDVNDLALPQWGDFRASYAFPLSRQWNVWKSVDGKTQGQAELAQFFEDNIRDIADPAVTAIPANLQLMIDRLNLHVGAPAKILETARGMEIRSTEKVRQAINTDTGEQVIVYEQEHANGGNATVTELRVPTAFLLTIPVFQNDGPYLLLCRLRYRKSGAGVHWLINIQGADAALEDAFARGCDGIQEGTGVTLFYGKPPEKTEL